MNRILVVDDRPLDAAVAVRLLRGVRDWDVEQHSSGKVALESLKLVDCDLVLTDLHMPGMDGLALMKAVHRFNPILPVVVMTSRGNEQKAVTALESGAASYLPKTRLETDLIPTCRRVMEAARLRRDQAALMNHLREERFELLMDNNRVHVSALVELIVSRCLQFRVCDPARAPRIGVAVEEAVVNAMIHGNLEVSSDLREDGYEEFEALIASRLEDPAFSERPVVVRVRLTLEECRITIRDHGPGFNLRKLRDPTDPENLSRVSGRGILLMRSFLDDVRYNDRGNEVTLTIRRDTGFPDPVSDLRVAESSCALN